MVESRAFRTGLCLPMLIHLASCATVSANYPLVPPPGGTAASASSQSTYPAGYYTPSCTTASAGCAALALLAAAAAAGGPAQTAKALAPKTIRGKCWLESSEGREAATPCFGMILALRELGSSEESFARPDAMGRFGFLVIPGKSYALAVKSKTLQASLESAATLRAGDEVVVRLSPAAEPWPDSEFATAHAAVFRVPASDLN